MKRILTLTAALMFAFGVAGNAAANFDQGTFVATANDGTNEIVAGLNFLENPFDGNLQNSVQDTGIDLSFFSEADSWADVNLGGVADQTSLTTGQYDVMVAVDDASTAAQAGAGWTITTAIDGIYYNSSVYGSDAAVQVNAETKGYTGDLNATMSLFLDGSAEYLLSAADIGVGKENAIVMDIAYFVSTWGAGWTVEDTGADLYYYLDEADGTLIAEVVAVPVPGALILFGSALLGLVGIRRKNA